MKSFLAFLAALPKLLKLYQIMRDAAENAEDKQLAENIDKKVKDDLEKIAEAWKEQDVEKLNEIFNS